MAPSCHPDATTRASFLPPSLESRNWRKRRGLPVQAIPNSTTIGKGQWERWEVRIFSSRCAWSAPVTSAPAGTATSNAATPNGSLVSDLVPGGYIPRCHRNTLLVFLADGLPASQLLGDVKDQFDPTGDAQLVIHAK